MTSPVNGASAPLVLAILDGVGSRPNAADNAVLQARAPFLHALLNGHGGPSVVHRELRAHGPAVGLSSEADMGNSEVGHKDRKSVV